MFSSRELLPLDWSPILTPFLPHTAILGRLICSCNPISLKLSIMLISFRRLLNKGLSEGSMTEGVLIILLGPYLCDYSLLVSFLMPVNKSPSFIRINLFYVCMRHHIIRNNRTSKVEKKSKENETNCIVIDKYGIVLSYFMTYIK
jgi:hypothetical protein